MPPLTKTLVVGTTPDYIAWLRRESPGTALFLTDRGVWHRARESHPPDREEILCDLSDTALVETALSRHLNRENMALDGIACFDCESMGLAAVLAFRYGLSYPSSSVVANCRDKHRSKTLWRRHGLVVPVCQQVRTEGEAAAFFRSLGAPCVLKPASGSGSELIFSCRTEQGCAERFREIRNGLNERRSMPMYRNGCNETPVILAEELIEGPEFSCDFLVVQDRVELLRLTAKIIDVAAPFGTTLAYVLPAHFPPEINRRGFEQILLESAHALGITRSVCMLDFMVRGKDIFLIEMAPRPGGDCLPFLLKTVCNFDMLKLNLDFACNRPHLPVRPPESGPYLGLRFHARKSGRLNRIDTTRLAEDPRVMDIQLIRFPGDDILLPPENYDNWVLGHAVVRPYEAQTLADQCRELADLLLVEIGES